MIVGRKRYHYSVVEVCALRNHPKVKHCVLAAQGEPAVHILGACLGLVPSPTPPPSPEESPEVQGPG